MTARSALLALGGAAAAWPWWVRGQGASAWPRVGVLTPAGAEILKRPESSVASFVAGLRDLGHADGRSVTLEFRFADQALDQLPALAAELVRQQPQVIYTHTNPAARAAARRRPLVSSHYAVAGDGGLLSMGTDIGALGRRAAWQVHRILAGAKPGDLAVERPSTFRLTLNLKTARALKLTVPQSLLLRADEVIQ